MAYTVRELEDRLIQAYDEGDADTVALLKEEIQRTNKVPAQTQQKQKAGVFSRETLAVPFAQVGNAADTAASLIAAGGAGLFGDKKEQESIFKNLDERTKARLEWANPSKKEQSLPAQLVGTVATLPMQLATLGVQSLPEAVQAVQAGESGESARNAALLGTVANTAMGVLPGAVGKTALQKVGTGALIGAAQDPATRLAQQQLVDTEAAKELYSPTIEGALIGGILGGGVGALHAGPSNVVAESKSLLNNFKKKSAEKRSAKLAVDYEIVKQNRIEAANRIEALKQAEIQGPIDKFIAGEKQPIPKEVRKQLRKDFPRKEVTQPYPELIDPVLELPETITPDATFPELRAGLETTLDTSPIDMPAASMRNLEDGKSLLASQSNVDGYPVLLENNLVDRLDLGFADYTPEAAVAPQPARHFDSPINKELQVVPKEWAKVEMARRPEVPLPIKNTRETGLGAKYDSKKSVLEAMRKKQGGAIHPDLLTVGASKLIEKYRNEPVKALAYFRGIFGNEAITKGLKETQSPEATSRIVWMKPERFTQLAKQRSEDYIPTSIDKHQRLGKQVESPEGWNGAYSIPELELAKDGVTVIGHDGRHRADVLRTKGIDMIPVRLSTRGMVKNKEMPSHTHLISENGVPLEKSFTPFSQEVPLGLRKPSQGGWIGNRRKWPQTGDYKSLKQLIEENPTLDPEILSKMWRDEGRAVTHEDIGTNTPLYGWAGDNAFGNEYNAQNKAVVNAATDIPSMGSIMANTHQQGAAMKRKLNNPAATYGINVVDSLAREATKNVESVLTPLDEAVTHTKKLYGLDKMRDGFLSLAQETPDMSNPVTREARKVLDTLAPKLQEAYALDQKLSGVTDPKQLNLVENYFPRTNWGEFVAFVTDASGRVLHRIMGTRNEVRAGIKYFKGQDVVKVSEMKVNEGGVYDNYDVESGFAPDDFLGDMRVTGLGEAAPTSEAGFQDRFKQRVGSLFWKGNEPWLSDMENAKNANKVVSRYARNAENYIASVKSKESLASMFKDVGDRMPNLLELLSEYHANTFKRNQGTVAKGVNAAVNTVGRAIGKLDPTRTLGATELRNFGRTAKRMTTALMLGLFRTKTAVLQAVQGPMVANAELARMTGYKSILSSNLQGAVAAALTPFDMALSAATGGKKTLGALTPGDTGKLLKYMEDNRVVDSFVADQVIQHEAITPAQKASQLAEEAATVSIRATDQIGRAYAFAAMTRALKETYKIPLDEAMPKARDLVDTLMANSARRNQAYIGRKLGYAGEFTTNLRTFLMMELHNLIYDVHNSFKGSPQHMAALAAKLGILFGMGGLAAMPGVEDIDDLYKTIVRGYGAKVGDIDLVTAPGVKELAVANYPDLWTGPIGTALGIDTSGVGISSIFPRSVSELGYAPGSKLLQIFEGASEMGVGAATGNFRQGLLGARKVFPDTYGMKAWMEKESGEKLPNGNYLIPDLKGNKPTEFTPEEMSIREAGFVPREKALERALDWELIEKDKALTEAQKEALTDFITKSKDDNWAALRGKDTNFADKRLSKYLRLGGDPNALVRAMVQDGVNDALARDYVTRGIRLQQRDPQKLKQLQERLELFKSLRSNY